MSMKTLNIQSNRPVLDITTTNAALNITNKIRRFSAKRIPPEMTVERKAPSFKVNWKKVWGESGRKSPDDLRIYQRDNSRSKVERYIQRVSENGTYVMKLENYKKSETNPLAETSYQDMISELPEMNVASMPESSPEVTWDPGYVRIEWSTGELQIDWDDNFMPEIKVSPHSVEIRLAGKNAVQISVNEDNIPVERGRKINKRI